MYEYKYEKLLNKKPIIKNIGVLRIEIKTCLRRQELGQKCHFPHENQWKCGGLRQSRALAVQLASKTLPIGEMLA